MLTKTKKFVLVVIGLSIAGLGLFIYLRSLQDNTAAPNGGGGGASTTTNPTPTTDQTNTQSGGSSASNANTGANTGANTDTGQGGGNTGAAVVATVLGVLAAAALIVLVKLKKSGKVGTGAVSEPRTPVAPRPEQPSPNPEPVSTRTTTTKPSSDVSFDEWATGAAKQIKLGRFWAWVNNPDENALLGQKPETPENPTGELPKTPGEWNPDAKPEKSSLVKQSRFIEGEAAKAGKAVGAAAKTVGKKVEFVAGDVGKTVPVAKWLNADLVQSKAQELENMDNSGYVHPGDDGKSFFEE